MNYSRDTILLVRVGRILGTFGVRGDLKCAYTTDHPEWLSLRSSYLVVDPSSGECVIVVPAKVELRQRDFLLRIEGHDAPEPLKRFAGCDIVYAARRGELERAEDEVYLFELVGMEVRRPGGELLGVVTDVLETGAHVVLELEGEKPRLIPFTRQHVPEVHLEEGYLVTTYPLDGQRSSG